MSVFKASSIAEWEDISSNIFVPLKCTGVASNFRARIDHRSASSGVAISRIASDQVVVQRSSQAAREYVDDNVLLNFQLNATSTVVQGNRSARLSAGGFAAYDPRAEYTLIVEEPRQEMLVLQVSRRDLGVSEETLSRMTARPLDAATPGARALFALVKAGFREPASIPVPVAHAIEQLTGSVLLAAAGAGPGWTDDAATIAAVKHYALRSLSDPKLSVEELAAGQFLSVRKLHALFTATGDTPGSWLRRARIAHAERLLTSSLIPIYQIGVQSGYPDQSAFGRAFRRERGMSPSDYREQSRSQASG